jgi:hypothetical protein
MQFNTEIESDVHNKISLYQACIELLIDDWERDSSRLEKMCLSCVKPGNLKNNKCPSCKEKKQEIYDTYKFLNYGKILGEESSIDDCINELKDCKKLLKEVNKIRKEVEKFGKIHDC